MSPRLLLILTCLVGGCATSTGDTPPVCDGRNRRPANPHGSILLSPPPPPPASASEPMASAGGCA